MKIPIYQIDAFAEHVFAGNPAAVCPLREWVDDALQAVAQENNLSETSFFVPEAEGYQILCGHMNRRASWPVDFRRRIR